ncbi:hypothetical protein [Catellatospora sp. NPDC049609]|uniref:hypothetical protein n=1 Tax=Catellatospora sp. NPDC049609 TaxID=3155505 RepID=UPI00341FCC49
MAAIERQLMLKPLRRVVPVVSIGMLGILLASLAPVGAASATWTSPLGDKTYFNLPSTEVETSGWAEGMQGVSFGSYAGDQYVFFSSRTKIHGWPIGNSTRYGLDYLKRTPTWHSNVPDDLPGEPHFGDLDFEHNVVGTVNNQSDLIYVPYEDNKKRLTPRLAVFRVNSVSTNITYVGHGYVGGTAAKEMPWVAVKTGTQCIYTSEFHIHSSSRPFGVSEYCDSNPGDGVTLQGTPIRHQVRDFDGDQITLGRVQGGDFIMRTPTTGYLFLLAEEGPGADGLLPGNGSGSSGGGRGVYVFTTNTTIANGPFSMIDFIPAEMHPDRSEEYEGVAVGEVDPAGANDLAHIHAIVTDNNTWEPAGQGYYFKHWRVTNDAGLELR